MAFNTINERISALNVATFGVLIGLFIPLQADGDITSDDGENSLGYYIGVVPPEPSSGARRSSKLSFNIGNNMYTI